MTTDADGNYSYLAPRGPSRQIRVDYTAFSGDPRPTATRLVRMSTQAGVRMTARKQGDTFASAAACAAARSPRSGLLVVLQGYQAGYGWRTFRTARVSGGGRFSTLLPLAHARARDVPLPRHHARADRVRVRHRALARDPNPTLMDLRAEARCVVLGSTCVFSPPPS